MVGYFFKKKMRVKRIFMFEENAPGIFLSLKEARSYVWGKIGRDKQGYDGDHLITVDTRTDEVIAVRRVSVKGSAVRFSLM